MSVPIPEAVTALALVQGYCGWRIAPSQTETLTLDGNGASALMLPSLHVTAVTSVTVDGTVLDDDAYDWSAVGMIELRCGRFPHRFRSVEVVFESGYNQMPDEVQAIIDQLTEDGLSGSLVQIGPFRFADSASGDESVVSQSSVLDRYRLPPRP